MTREELKAHCERQIQEFERVEKIMPVTPNAWKHYEEHKLVLELLEQESVLDKIRAEIIAMRIRKNVGVMECLSIIDKYREELNWRKHEESKTEKHTEND